MAACADLASLSVDQEEANRVLRSMLALRVYCEVWQVIGSLIDILCAFQRPKCRYRPAER